MAFLLAALRPAWAAEPLEDSVRTVPDSAARTLRAPGSLSRIMAEADSAVKAQGGPKAPDAQLYLSWNAPWATKRAQQARKVACADSTTEDTLYLSFLAGRKAQRFTGFTGLLHFRATASDTLGPWWHMEGKGGENAGSLRVEWAGAPGS